ncbi:hypothetical protein O3P69_019084 [Scylla paramamosain]|uniref:CD80-like immunoglobulin C2-set domain-containing protein n=1 Tax=Scylla paramamosain TaxID=85552 RepID=A0AAW0T7M8_SCYPA
MELETSLSDQKKVTLRPVSLLSSGKYRCEVSADAPSFHTESQTAEMLVVDLPDQVPTITGGRSKYHVGDEVHVNCTSLRSRPAASLMWYINDNQASTQNLVEYTPVNDTDGLETSRLGLRFVVGARHFPSGELRLKCSASYIAIFAGSSGFHVRFFCAAKTNAASVTWHMPGYMLLLCSPVTTMEEYNIKELTPQC